MIPLRDTNESRTRPFVNTLLVVANIVVFLYELTLGRGAEHFLRQFGVIPVDIISDHTTGILIRFRPLVTSMFLHGGWLHLIGNMLFLWVFGDNVEDRLGHVRYLLFYILGGIAANVAHLWLNPGSTVPTVGASGAIAAVLGAYSFLFPGARVLALVPLGFFLQTFEIPAKLFLGIWFIFQLFSGATSLAIPGATAAGGVAWWAHVGGFIFGIAVAYIFCRDRRRPLAPAWQE